MAVIERVGRTISKGPRALGENGATMTHRYDKIISFIDPIRLSVYLCVCLYCVENHYRV
jgi:hypothetical protein